MKKNTKGAIAAGAAALLLAGGAGTFAAWSDEASLEGGEVTSGHLRITAEDAGTWSWANGDDFDPESDRLVPGDVVKYTAEYELEVLGNNLVASLTSELGDVSGDLAEYLTVTTESTDDITNITEENDGDTVSVTTVITFDPETSGQNGMDDSADLSGSTITLQQTAPAGPATP